MRILLDSHALIWAVDRPALLSDASRSALQDVNNRLTISAATVWELSIKIGLGKLQLTTSLRDWLQAAMRDLGLELLPITIDHADRQTQLPFHHRDPFDRLLIAQALVEQMPLVSCDAKFDPCGVSRIW